jgi:hypothetical protein
MGGGDSKVNRGPRCDLQWRVPPPLRPSCGGTGLFRLSHPLPNVSKVPNVLNVPSKRSNQRTSRHAASLLEGVRSCRWPSR